MPKNAMAETVDLRTWVLHAGRSFTAELGALVYATSMRVATAGPDSLDAAIVSALDHIGTATQADRVYIFRFRADSATVDCTHEWCAPQVLPQRLRFHGVTTESLPWIFGQLRGGHTVVIPKIRALSAQAHAERVEFMAENIQSMLCTPLWLDNRVAGFMELDTIRTEHTWSLDVALALELVGEIMLGAVLRTTLEDHARDSDSLFRAIFQAAKDGIVLADPVSMLVTMTNPGMCEMLGYSAEEMNGLPIRDLHTSNDWPPIEARFRAVFSGRKLDPEEIRVRRKDGSTFLAEINGRKIDIGGHPYMLGVFRDVTARKESLAALRFSEERFRSAMHNSGIGMAIVAPDGRWLEVNSALCDLLGYDAGELLAMDFQSITHPDDLEKDLDLVHQMLTRRITRYQINKRYLCKDGNIVWATLTVSLTWNEDGTPAHFISQVQDITHKHNSEKLLHLQSSALDSAPHSILITDLTGSIEWVNRAFSKATGYSPAEVIGQNPRMFKSGRQTPDFYRTMFATILGGQSWRGEIINRYKEGREVPEAMTITPVRAEGGGISHFISIKQDLTLQKMQEGQISRLNRMLTLLSGVNATIIRVKDATELARRTCDLAVESGGFLFAWMGLLDESGDRIVPIAHAGHNDGFLEQIDLAIPGPGERPATFIARSLREQQLAVVNQIHADPAMADCREPALARGYQSATVLPLVVDGNSAGVLMFCASQADFFDPQELKLLEELRADVSFALETIRKEQQIFQLMHHDPLTDLANREVFLERLGSVIGCAHPQVHKIVLLVLDLVHFRNINDALGRSAGDDVLKQFAARLEAATGDRSRIARLTGDRFGMYLSVDIAATGTGGIMGESLLQLFDGMLKIRGQEIRVAVKAGAAIFPDDGADVETLFRNAEAALQKAKHVGDHCVFYAPEFNARLGERLTLEARLRRAVEGREFLLHYQPKVDMKTRQITGLEALLRWPTAPDEWASPAIFVPVLEESGLVLDVGHWAMCEAVAQFDLWVARALPAPRISVNVSSVQLKNRDFVAAVRRVLGTRAPGECGLDLEITESLLMENIDASIERLREVCSYGVRIALDDFGTGYSSLAYLNRLPVTTLKIDRTFILEMESSEENTSIVNTIIGLGRVLNMKVVAEGVETEEQAKLLRLLHCDEMQGYLFSPAVPAATIETMLSEALTDCRP